MKKFLTLSLLLVLVACSSSSPSKPDCTTGMVLPEGFPDNMTATSFGGLIFNTCQYSQAEMNSLNEVMGETAFAVTACLNEVYDWDLEAETPDHNRVPYFSKINIVPEKFQGRDGKWRHIQYLQAGYFVKFHPTKRDGAWDMQWWAGEVHTMYRTHLLKTFDHAKIYDKNLPFTGAAKLADDTCIDLYKPEEKRD